MNYANCNVPKGAWLHDVCCSGSEESVFHAAGKPCEQHPPFNMVLPIVMIDVSVTCRL